MNIKNGITELIGNTPLVRVSNFEKQTNTDAKILAKVEFFNPAGSAKDRIALQMTADYEKSGILKKGSVIIEPTSGNTGIGLAALCAKKGYRMIVVMPENMSEERKLLMKAYGAELVLTEAKAGMQGSIDKANELKNSIENSVIAGQFVNMSNPKAHYLTTGKEIYDDTDGEIDIFIAGVGTGGTLSGIGKYLKEKNKNIKIVAVEPYNSPLLSKGVSGSHGLQGIGANFVPEVLNREIIDEIITVTEADAYKYANIMAKSEGLLVGISSGAALAAAVKLSEKKENKDKNIVVLLPDSGERYLSTDLYK